MSKQDKPVEPPISPYRRRVERRLKALELRTKGNSFQTIANKLGISKWQAIRAVKAALEPSTRHEREMVALLRNTEGERLDWAVEMIKSQMKQGDLRAVELWMNLSTRRSKLLGLDRPVEGAADQNDGRPMTVRVEYVNDPDADD